MDDHAAFEETLPLESFEDVWKGVPDQAALVEASPEETLRYDGDAVDDRIASLPSIPLRSVGAEPSLFEVHATRLGMGGMGEVRLATQAGLSRDVAIKLVRSRGGVQQPTRILLREALVMGYLEHPNICPIHLVGRDEKGEPVVAMKRIEGITLAEKLHRAERLQELDENLDVLLGVCNALDYAHQKGVVHLDLKPSNVMIGPFGEVYLLDWGTAVAYREDVPSTIPRPMNDRRIRGTPAYMAPELIAGLPPTPATDVYLLGGLLHALLTGRGPNQGDTTEDIFAHAFISPPRPLPLGAPVELREVMDKALHRDPTQRYSSAAELKSALLDFRAKRAARDVLASARRNALRFAELAADDAAAAEIYAAFGAARQLLVDAERLAPDPAEVLEDRQTTFERMAEWELAHDNPAGALQLIHELPNESPELKGRAEAALAARRGELEELHNLRREIDPGVANRAKVVMWLAIAFAIGAIHLIPFALGVRSTAGEVLLGHVAYLAILLGVTTALRGRLFATRTNREMILLIWMLSLFGLMVRGCAAADLLHLGTAIGLDLGLVALTGVFAAIVIDRRLTAALPWLTLAAAGSFAFPEYGVVWFGVGHFLTLTTLALVYSRSDRPLSTLTGAGRSN